MYRLHTVDIYLWTQNDASMFLDSLRRVLQPHQLQIIADPKVISPTSQHHEHKNDTMSPVIANLERAAISHQSRTSSISSTQAFPGPPQAAFPGPPARTSTTSPAAATPIMNALPLFGVVCSINLADKKKPIAEIAHARGN